MSFVEFLRRFSSEAVRPQGFLGHALGDPRFPEMRSWADLNSLPLCPADDRENAEEAQWYWREYQAGSDGGTSNHRYQGRSGR